MGIRQPQNDHEARIPLVPPSIAKPCRGTQKNAVVIALDPQEFQLFLPSFAPEQTDHYQWLDTSRLKDPARWQKALEEHAPSVLVTGWNTPRIPECWAIAPDSPLRYVCHITGSVRHTVPRSLIEHGIIVTNWGSLVSHTIAEHALLLILGALRNVPLWGETMKRPSYSVLNTLPSLRTRSLRGKRVGLHGFGSIARELVQMLKPHGVHLYAHSAPVPREYIESYGITYCGTLETLFSNSDILVECESLTPKNKGVVTEQILQLLPEDAIFVNIGRALLTDGSALVRLAREKRLRLAVDVYDHEPPDSEWIDLPNALLSPHIAGPTWDTYPACGKRALDNVERFLRGENVEGPISLQVYDLST